MGSFSLHLNSPVLKHWQKIARVLGYPDLGIPKVFACGIRNPGHRNQEFSKKDSPGVPLTIGIPFPTFTDMESGIDSVESKIQDREDRLE